MDNTATISSGCAGLTTEQEQKIFKSTLFGFKRDEVLSYIERLHLENCKATASLREQIEQLEVDISIKNTDISSFMAKAEELENELFIANERADNAEELVNALRIEADKASDEAAAHKSRLFAKEQEAVVLKADNARLNQTIASLTITVTEFEAQKEELARLKQQVIDEAKILREQALLDAETVKQNALNEMESIKAKTKAELQAAETAALQIHENAENDAKNIRSKASNDAVALVSAAEKEKLDAKRLVNSSAEVIAHSIVELKNELADIDRKISAAVSELGKITGGINAALTNTEKDLESLGVQLEKFPEPVKKAVKAPVRPHQVSFKHKSVAESIIDKLTSLLK